jgi:hypothetical protein
LLHATPHSTRERESPEPLDDSPDGDARSSHRVPGPRLGALPLARRDVERLRQVLGLQRRLRDLDASPRTQRALTHRHIFREALTWLEIHGHAQAAVEHWITVLAQRGAEQPIDATSDVVPPSLGRRRRRRRRRRPRSAPGI